MRGNSTEKRLVSNAAVIAVGAFAAKVIGAFYRIPLTNLLGSAGLGLYQMVFPVYCILLDFAGAGLPCGLSKLVSENNAEGRGAANASLLRSSLLMMLAAGALASLAMFALARPVSALQGNAEAYKSYMTLAPAVLLVALLSCFRGYFQGYEKMSPTALSQLTEQIVKLGAGLLFVKFLMPDAANAAAGAALAVTFSEAAALFQLVVTYRIYRKKGTFLPLAPLACAAESGAAAAERSSPAKPRFWGDVKGILKICLPVTLVGIALPVSQMIDSFLIINLLGKYAENATSLYGLFSGGVQSVLSLPVSVCYGIAVAAVPLISGVSKKDKGGGAKYAYFAVALTGAFSLVMAAGCFLLPDFIVRVLFFSLSAGEKAVVVKLLKLTAPCIVFMSVLQTVNSVLIGKSRPYAPLFGLGAGVLVKTVLEIFLLPVPDLNIFAAAISLCACYLVAVFINLLYIIRVYKNKGGTLLTEEKPHEDKRKLTRKYKADCS